VSDRIRSQMGQITKGACLLLPACSVGENFQADGPSMAVLQVVGEFLPDSYVGRDAAIQKIKGEFTENSCHGSWKSLKIAED